MVNASYISYADTHSFSPLVIDYLAGAAHLNDLISFPADASGLAKAMEARSGFTTNRKLLFNTLSRQYENLPQEAAVNENLRLLQAETTFTICTAHQPNLGTGYLYFIYKILHAIKLSQELKTLHPDKDFVPVYYIGSEDADLDELGTFRYGNKKFVWDAAGQTGAVGRMDTSSLKPLLNDLFQLLGPPGEHLDELKELLQNAYLHHPTIATATQYLVHRLFGKYGLVALDPDDAALKRTFIEVMKQDLLAHTSLPLVTSTIATLGEHGYKMQAYPRPINLFYLRDDIRERIERVENEWVVVNTSIRWNEAALLEELNSNPERFSPNVILRGLYQETILPNIAFIGGGAEVAYWLQLLPVFQAAAIPFPVIILRQSAMWISRQAAVLRKKTGLTITEIFMPEAELTSQFLNNSFGETINTQSEQQAFIKLLIQLKGKATALDSSLKGSTEAVMAKINHQLQVLEKKMMRAGKRKSATSIVQLTKLKTSLFPGGGLQERFDNFMEFYLQSGHAFFDLLLEHIHPLENSFLILEDVPEE